MSASVWNRRKPIEQIEQEEAKHGLRHEDNGAEIGRAYFYWTGRRGGTAVNEKDLLSYAVYNALGVGPEQARSRRELCAAVGCTDRELRQAIERLRYRYTILTNDDGRGYYLPTLDDRGRSQALSWLKRQERRRASIQRARKGARRFVGSREE